ncbi:MAG: lysine--tRNA ligase [Candidatus Altiarchaeota archaeon]|nr:lysine--tRNA ligase [Candidatus Altiarchaeota archaeon]
MHWSDEAAERLGLRGGSQVIETGTSISGIPHIGNASDVIRGDCVRRSCQDAGVDARLIWVSDDMDPFRKVPAGMESLKDYLGFPVKDIPDPKGCHSSFVDHFANPFIEDLKEFGVEPKIYSATELYRSGAFKDEVVLAFEGRKNILEILNRFRKEPLPDDFVPWTPICQKCGKISTTTVTGLDGTMVSYECVDKEVAGGDTKGCGYVGVQDALKGFGKFPWRVEWAAKWHHFKVTCEPFGKDHAAAGGSYDTSKIISEEVFNWPAPIPVAYEFFTLNGAKISSSKGNVITLSDWLKIAEPEVLRYFMFKKLNKARDINLRMLPNLVDEFDQIERMHFGKESGDVESKRMYQLSQVQEPKYLNIPYTFCAVLGQVSEEQDYESRARWNGYDGFDTKRLKNRAKLAGNWVEKYGPDYLRFTLKTAEEVKAEYLKLDSRIQTCLTQLVDALESVKDPSIYHKKIYETARANNVDPPELFTAIYKTLIGKEKGPKAAMFLMSLGEEYLKQAYK